MVTKVLMHIHTEKQKERVNLHGTITSNFATQRPHHYPQGLPLSHTPKTLSSLTLQPPSFTPLPMAWKKSLSSKTPPLYDPVNLLHHSPWTHPQYSSHRFPITLPSTSILTDTHFFISQTMVSLVIQKACGQRKEGTWFAIARRIKLACLRTGRDLLLLCLVLVLENHPWGRGHWGSDPLLKGP